jgi:hypothetical protein
MNNRLLCLIGIFLIPGYLFGADNPAAIGRLNLEGSTYTPGGEPTPLMVWAPRATIEEGSPISDHIVFALQCFHRNLPKTVEKAKTRCNKFTQEFYSEEERVKVAVGRDDMQKIIDSLK